MASTATRKTRYWLHFLFIAILSVPLSAQTVAPVIETPHGPNTPEQEAKHYVVLVSLDGFRYDYAERYGAKNLHALGSDGATAPDGMIPSYTSLTFPNHYAIVSGLYPEHHGIVAMSFYDPKRKQRYAYNDPVANTDGTWYGGVPLWSLAEQQGMRSACFFWPGSEAEIAGQRPSYYLHFDDHFPDEARIQQVLDWLRLPPARRPHFITLYYSNVDHAGHQFGPDSQQTIDAVHHVDELIGTLRAKLKDLSLPIDLFVVSDHGMDNVQGDWINLDHFTDLSAFHTEGMLLYSDDEAAIQKAYEHLKGSSDKFAVYRRRDVPRHLHFDDNERIGDPVIIPTGPYAIRAHAADPSDTVPKVKGVHGYDPQNLKTMRAIFYAAGPDIRPHTVVLSFENVNIYPLILRILGLKSVPNDGDPKVLENILNSPAPGKLKRKH
jgi:predicted AlkP superfamily pyrophosphatase or phosphodiesterase